MLRFLTLFSVLFFNTLNIHASSLPLSVSHVDAAIERAMSNMDAADPNRDVLLNSYRETRSILQGVDQQKTALKVFTAARTNAYQEAKEIKAALNESLKKPAEAIDTSVPLAELEQLIQLDKSDLAILQNQLTDVLAQLKRETDRPAAIQRRLTELGSSFSDLEANLKVRHRNAEQSRMDEAQLWHAQAQVTSNRAKKMTLDEELLSQPMRLELLSAQRDKAGNDIILLEKHLLLMEEQSGKLRQGEARKVLADAETAQAEALGKHILIQDMADRNTVFSATLGERSTAIEGVRETQLQAAAQANEFERELETIERKLEILGMTKTVGKILREQAARLPTPKTTDRNLSSIVTLIGDSSLRQMELLDERRKLRDIQTYVQAILAEQDSTVADAIGDDLLQLSLSRRELVTHAIDVETTYARALTNLDFSVHRLATAADKYRGFISVRLLWVQSRDPVSWSLFTQLPTELAEAFSPVLWLQLAQWLIKYIFVTPLILGILLLALGLVYLSPQIKFRLAATGNVVGMVRTDSFVETFKAFLYTILLTCKWPLLLLACAVALGQHEADSVQVSALHMALMRTTLFYLALEFIRTLLLPRGLVEAHFRWPTQRVRSLNSRVVRFEQTFLTSAFFAIYFMQLYPSDVGGSVGTIAVALILISMAYFFSRMPHFVQGKVDSIFTQPKVRIHSFWGALIRFLLAWVPIAMVVALLFGYTYTALEVSTLIIKTVLLFTGLLLLHELGIRWLRLTRRRLRLKAQEELARTNNDDAPGLEDDTLEHDPELLDDEGTKLLNALLLIGGLAGIAVVWSDVFPALGILDAVELWQRTDSVNGQDLVVQTTLADAFSALVLGIIGWIVIRRLPGLLEILLRRRMEVAAPSAYAAATIVKYGLTTIVAVMVLSMLGGSWSQIQWAVAALSLGIGFGLQEIVANFFSGLIILFEQPIRVGDSVTVGDTSGVVTKIEMRATTIRDWDRRELLVPNKEFVTGRLLNWSLSDPIIRIHIEVGVAYGTDMDKAMEVVSQAAANHPLVLSEPEPLVTFEAFGDSSMNISLRYFLEESEQRLPTSSAIRLEISREFNKAGISVAFPQRDVHLDASRPLDIRVLNTPPSSA